MNANKKTQKLVQLNQELRAVQNEMRKLKILERVAVFVLFGILLIAMAIFGPLEGAFVTFGFALLFAAFVYWRRRPYAARIKEIRRKIVSTR